MTSDPNKPTVRNEVEATQGSKAPGMIYVLVSGLVLAIVAVAAVWAFQR